MVTTIFCYKHYIVKFQYGNGSSTFIFNGNRFTATSGGNIKQNTWGFLLPNKNTLRSTAGYPTQGLRTKYVYKQIAIFARINNCLISAAKTNSEPI